MLKVNNKNTRKRRETCSKLMIKTPERPQWHHSSIFIANFKHISHVFPRFAHISTSQLANFSANWSVKLANFSAQYGTPSKVMLRYFCKTSKHFSEKQHNVRTNCHRSKEILINTLLSKIIIHLFALTYLVISFIVIKSFIASLALFCYSMHHMVLCILTYYCHLNEDKLLYIYKQLRCF